MIIENVLYEFLEDDDTEFGGTSFAGERVIDFIQETELTPKDNVKKLNKALKQCGIKPIKSK